MKCVKIFVYLFTGFVVQCSAMSLSELEDFANYLKKTSQLDETLKKGTDPNDFEDDETVSDHAWEESGKFEGDLILNEKQRRMIVEDIAEGLARNGLRDGTKRWPDNEVIYYIQKEHFTSDQVQAVQDGIDDLARASCVKFRPYRKGDRDAVVIQGSRRGCFSQVGYQGGYQVLNLSGRHPVGRGCFRHGTVVHELLHTLGFYHMQSSPDRDDYVDIVWENIIQPARHNFRKYNAFSVSDFGVGYDYDSVLHYSKGAFSSNGQDTIVPKQSGTQIGQRLGLSDKDTQKLNKMYCDADNNNNDESDSSSQKEPNKKKKPKNKPFEGHGIGYHQGKTVVIKLLPTAETYHIMNKPAFSMFHYFSKAPQVLSSKEIEGFGPGRRIADSYKPYTYPGDDDHQSGKDVQEFNSLKTTSTNSDDYHKKIDAEEKGDVPKINNSDFQDKTEIDKDSHDKSSENENNDELSDAFIRLEKILKTHVYPTHSPDLKAYRVNSDYSEFSDPKAVPKIAYDIVPISSKEYNDLRKLSKSNYVTNLYNYDPKSLPTQKHEDALDHHKEERIKYDDSSSFKGIQKDGKANEKHNQSQNENSPFKDNLDSHEHKQTKTTETLESPDDTYKIIPSQNIHEVSKEAEESYRTSYPFKAHQHFSNGSLELKTPDYARYENLKDKHNYSSLYHPYIDENDDETEKRHYKILGDSVPTYNKWYQKDYLKRNPVDYDRPSFTYISPDSKSQLRVQNNPESSENDDSYESDYTGSVSPRMKQPYTLYGDPVPLTRKWYKVDTEKLRIPTETK